MPLVQQNYNSSMIFRCQITHNSDEHKFLLHMGNKHWFWSTRLVLINAGDDNEFWDFFAFDLLMNEARQIRFHKTYTKRICKTEVFSLDGNFGFIVMYYVFEPVSINLVKIDWETNEFKLIENFEREFYVFKIIIDKMNPSKFVLKWSSGIRASKYQACELINGKIKFGKISEFTDKFKYYSDEKLICVNSRQTQIKTCDLVTQNEHTFEIELSSLRRHVYTLHHEFINGCLFFEIQFQSTGENKFLCFDVARKQCTYLNFKTNMEIKGLKFFNDNLVVETSDVQKVGTYSLSEVKIYSIPIKKPNSLRQSAWLLVVHIMKNKEEKYPYKSAKEFLPLNSDLRAHWFKDEEKKIE